MEKSLITQIKRIDLRYIISIITILFLSALISFFEIFIVDPSFNLFVDNRFIFFALFALISLLNITLYVYLMKIHHKDKHKFRTLKLIFSMLVLTVFLCLITQTFIDPYSIPIALVGIVLVLLADKRIALFTTIIASQIVLISYTVKALTNGFGTVTNIADAFAIVTAMSSSLFIIFFIKQDYTRFKIISTTFIVSIIMGAFAALAATISKLEWESVAFNFIWTLAGNVVSVALALLILPIFEKVLGLVSNFNLMEYCSFSNPVLKRLKEEAPGTFNHCLVVGNLAEHCALAIGKNPTLARATAYYHDVGKLANSEFFIENQTEGYNPHDDLIPEVSVSVITKHTDAGANLLRKHNFPKIFVDVAQEHHGDSPLQFFYNKAKNITEGELEDDEYKYKGPKPSSITSAIVMICDIVEAATRNKGMGSKSDFQELVDALIKEKIALGQFDNCDITMNDLNIIKNTIVNVLPGVYHGRLAYPEEKKEKKTDKIV